jgi:hypothetical protein
MPPETEPIHPISLKMIRSPLAYNTLALAAVLSLAGCAADTPARIGAAATTPLSDLNIVRADIPQVLEQAQKQPYGLPEDLACTAISAEVRKLDEVLGADLDTPPSDARPSLIERGAEAAGNSAIGALQRTAEGVIPFRGWVRKLSGAERYSKRVAAAIAAGTVRRAFLKGIGATHNCSWNDPVQITAGTTQAQ